MDLEFFNILRTCICRCGCTGIHKGVLSVKGEAAEVVVLAAQLLAGM
jgi:hypothetical protein